MLYVGTHTTQSLSPLCVMCLDRTMTNVLYRRIPLQNDLQIESKILTTLKYSGPRQKKKKEKKGHIFEMKTPPGIIFGPYVTTWSPGSQVWQHHEMSPYLYHGPLHPNK